MHQRGGDREIVSLSNATNAVAIPGAMVAAKPRFGNFSNLFFMLHLYLVENGFAVTGSRYRCPPP